MSVASTPTARRWFRAPLPLLEPLLGAGPQLAQEIGIVDVRENAPGYMSIDEWADIYLGADNAERLRERHREVEERTVSLRLSILEEHERWIQSGIVTAEEVFATRWSNATDAGARGAQWVDKTPEEVLADLKDAAEALRQRTGIVLALPLMVDAPRFKYEPAMDATPRVEPWMFDRGPILRSPLPPAFTRFDDIDLSPILPMSPCHIEPRPRAHGASRPCRCDRCRARRRHRQAHRRRAR